MKNKTRFKFGKNWKSYSGLISEKNVQKAMDELLEMFDASCMRNKSFLDVGSGSGLFSLAANMLNAKVHSFDYDIDSVSCTKSLKAKFVPTDNTWEIEQGDILNSDYINALGKFDYVYSWEYFIIPARCGGHSNTLIVALMQMDFYLSLFTMIKVRNLKSGAKSKKRM